MPIKHQGSVERMPQGKKEHKAVKADEVRMQAVEGQDTQGLKAAVEGGRNR